MTLLAAENISKRFFDQIILADVSFTISTDSRIGLVGKNGVGKTTLLEILAGKQEIDAGLINRAKSCRMDYVEQEKAEYLHFTLFDFVAGAREDILRMRRDITRLEKHLQDDPHDEESLMRLGALQHSFEAEGGFYYENELEVIISGLGFEESRYRDRLCDFSGGEKNRAGLARLLAGNGNLLLLDEPTNHLDIESTRWLEEYLQKLGKAFIVVSHDRAFLTATVDTVWEMNRGSVDMYAGGYERYLEGREERRRLTEHYYKHQQEEIHRIEDFIRRNIAGQKTKQAQSKLKYLSRIKRLPPPVGDGKGPMISVESSGRSFNHVLSVENVSFGYGETAVVSDVTFDIYRGDRFGLIGRNGSGKSTILKSLIGELDPVSGSVRLGNNVDVAYFDQDLSDLNEDGTVLENVWEKDPTAEVGRMRSFLARFGFIGEDALKRVDALSGGEKTKLCLARLLYRPANFVIFDEPTNHLDVYAREALENALLEFSGSCLIVSHDRYFLDRVVDRIIHISEGRVRVYDGNYSYFLERTTPPEPARKVKAVERIQEYEAFKERSRRRSYHKKALQSTRSKIADLERELERLEQDIRSTIPRDDWEQLQQASERKKDVENRVLELYSRLEELEGREVD
jgi:ATP-binding cassette subfamily F protein 3